MCCPQLAFGLLALGDILRQLDVGLCQARLARLRLSEDAVHADQQAGQHADVADLLECVRGVELEIEQLAGIGHEDGLADQADEPIRSGAD